VAIDRLHPGNSVRTAVVWEVVRSAFAFLAGGPTGSASLEIVDLGGGTGGFAVPLAQLGHRVTVVDPSPDALAALERRAAEAGVSSRVRAVQGDVGTVFEVLAPGDADAVLCHGVLEFADDPVEGCGNAARLLRPGGVASFLVANRAAAVVARVLGGHVDEALTVLRDPDGRFGAHDPMPRRFTEQAAREMLEASGLTVEEVHGVRIFADLVPAAILGSAAGAATASHEQLLALEAAAATEPGFRALATQVHLLGRLAA
jgi:S-adenosylmethionine-dependent methyltransferase